MDAHGAGAVGVANPVFVAAPERLPSGAISRAPLIGRGGGSLCTLWRDMAATAFA